MQTHHGHSRSGQITRKTYYDIFIAYFQLGRRDTVDMVGCAHSLTSSAETPQRRTTGSKGSTNSHKNTPTRGETQATTRCLAPQSEQPHPARAPGRPAWASACRGKHLPASPRIRHSGLTGR